MEVGDFYLGWNLYRNVGVNTDLFCDIPNRDGLRNIRYAGAVLILRVILANL